MCVTELNRLLDEIVLCRVVAGQVEADNDPAQKSHERQDRHNAQPRVDIGMAMEELAHRVDIRVPDSARALSPRASLWIEILRA
jgi:hypothetical protein